MPDRPKNNVLVLAGIVLFGKNDTILLSKQVPVDKPRAKPCWGLPEGIVHRGEELSEAVIRIAQEMAGLDVISMERFVRYLSSVMLIPSGQGGHVSESRHTIYHLADLRDKNADHITSGNAGKVRWWDRYCLPKPFPVGEAHIISDFEWYARTNIAPMATNS